MIDAGLLVYYGVLKDLAHFAGVYDQDDWFMVDERVQRFKPLFNDEYGGALIAEIVGYVSLTSQQLSEYHMAKFSDARGEMWTPVPYSVHYDDDAWIKNHPSDPRADELYRVNQADLPAPR